MPESLFSPWWHRVRDLKPRLRAGVTVQRQKYRDDTWYVLVDEASGRQHRINAPAYELIGRFDGRSTVHELWSALLARFGDQAPGQDEVVHTLQRLAEAELVQFDRAADIAGLFKCKSERARRRRPWVNPLAFSTRLFDPQRRLARLDGLARALYRPSVFALWSLIVGAAALAAAMYWGTLHAHAAVRMASAYYLALTWAAYPFIKVVHELGHALAVRRWGGEVHEFGITFFVFTPAPYVDASAASAFRERWQRAAVSAAGIMAELLIGAAALFIWLAVEPGLLSDVAFVVLFVCASSSLLFNGNPLLRFDGYYVLCDLLETPNLAARSHAYWLHLLHRAVGGDAASAPTCARGELKWLVLYAPASWLYRLTLCAALVLWAGAKSAILGWLGAALLLVFVIARPMYAMLRALWRSFAPGGERRRAGACIAGAAALVGAALLGVPVPDSVTAQGVVSPPEAATVRAESEGFVSALLAADGDFVEVGTPLVVLREPAVLTEREALQARLQGLLARQYDAIVRDPAQARNVMEEIERTRIELARAEQRIAQWTVRSKTAGRLVIPHAEDLPGSFVPQGGVLAYVLVPVAPQVRAALAQEHAARLRGAVSRVEVWLADARTRVPAHVVREVPAATRLLPSAALGEPAGGVHAVEPTDKQGTLALEPVFLFDVALAGGTLERLGQRAWVRFDLGTAPLALQWERRARQLLLRHFNPNT